MTYVHPYDDPDVIAGQGTVAMEILRQLSGPIDAVFIPVGGGGLAAGMAAYIKALRPEIKVVGVESTESACLAAALAAKERVVLPQVGIFADGVAVAQIGKNTWELCRTMSMKSSLAPQMKSVLPSKIFMTTCAPSVSLRGRWVWGCKNTSSAKRAKARTWSPF